MILFVIPGQLPSAKTPHKDAPSNWNAVVIGIALDEPTNSNALKVIIWPNAHPAPDMSENTNAIPPGKPIPLNSARTIAKIKVPTVAPKIWLTGRPPNLEAIVGNNLT